jgi:coproporphyrinogen III oxidase-like Fe-S oxidoreductase
LAAGRLGGRRAGRPWPAEPAESGRWATEAHRAPGEWLAAVEARGNGDSLREVLTLSDRAMEYLLMSMRLTEGMDVARYLAHGAELPQGRVTDLIGLGLVTQAAGGWLRRRRDGRF